jgi:hypothetical protein
MRNVFLGAIMIWTTVFGHSQTSHRVGALVGSAAGIQLKNGIRANFGIETRHLFKGFSQTDWEYDYVRTDITASVSYVASTTGIFSGGYMLIHEPGYDRHRLMQQFTLIDQWMNLRWAHRMMLDQTFGEGWFPRFRLRYRMATEIPLNGQAVDAGEFYIRVNNELVNDFNNNEFDLEVRLVPMVGFAMLTNAKIEWGMDYRTDSFLHGKFRNTYRFTMNYFLDF